MIKIENQNLRGVLSIYFLKVKYNISQCRYTNLCFDGHTNLCLDGHTITVLYSDTTATKEELQNVFANSNVVIHAMMVFITVNTTRVQSREIYSFVPPKPHLVSPLNI